MHVAQSRRHHCKGIKMPVITLPDGSQRAFDNPVSVLDVANDIGPGLAKATIAGKVNGELVDAVVLEHTGTRVNKFRSGTVASTIGTVALLTALGVDLAAVLERVLVDEFADAPARLAHLLQRHDVDLDVRYDKMYIVLVH